MILDNVINVAAVGARINMKNNEYWCWLLRVIVSRKHCEHRYLTYIISVLNNRRSTIYAIQQSLMMIEICMILKEGDFILLILQFESFFMKLLSLTTRTQSEISTEAISILSRIISFSTVSHESLMTINCGNQAKQSQVILKMLGGYMNTILANRDPSTRSLGIQMFSNMNTQSIIFHEPLQPILVMG